MDGVSGVCESIHPSDGIGGCGLCYVCFSGAHESSPVLDGVGVGQDHCLYRMNTHELHKTVKKELSCSHKEVPLCNIGVSSPVCSA